MKPKLLKVTDNLSIIIDYDELTYDVQLRVGKHEVALDLTSNESKKISKWFDNYSKFLSKQGL